MEGIRTGLNFVLGIALWLVSMVVYAQPTVSFSANPTCVGEEVHFINNSTGVGSPIASVLWDFGDGSGSTAWVPSHTFDAPGNYNVSLTLIDDNGDRSVGNFNLLINPKAIPGFNITTSDRCVGVTQNFNNTSSISSGIYSSNWDFGDGQSSTGNSPSHQYTTPGTYTVTLTTTSDNSCSSVISKEIIIYPEPSADFTTPTSICLGQEVTFLDNSSIATGNVSYSWDFGDFSPLSTQINPRHSFSAVGLYNVELTVTSIDGGCSDVVSKTIEVYGVPDVSFNFDDVCLGEVASFSNTSTVSTGTLSYSWDLGDGTVSSDENPSHEYANSGSYSVELMATSSDGCVQSMEREINVYPIPVANFESVSEVCLGESVSITSLATVTSGGLSHSWNLGDGNTSVATNTTHTYATSGLFTVELTVASDFGCEDVYVSQVRVYPESVGGIVTGANTWCADDDAIHSVVLSGHVGDVIRWERSLTGQDQWININNTTTSLDYSDLQQSTYFRAIVKSGNCQEIPSTNVKVQIDASSEGGELQGSSEVCTGVNSTSLQLTDYVGNIVDWEYAENPSGVWSSLGVSSNFYTVTNIVNTTYYRVRVSNGVCDEDTSSLASVVVHPETVGGAVSRAMTLCASDDNSYSLSLSGHVGNVIRWERSLTGIDQWVSINNTTTALNFSDLSETTYFRAIVKSGECDEEASQSARIQIDELSFGGNLPETTAVCSGANSTVLQLLNYKGVILDWESAADPNGPWVSLGSNADSFTPSNLTATTYYRVEVQNGICDSDYSNIATISVVPQTVGGNVLGSVILCSADDATYTLSLSGHIGEVLRWERSLTGVDQWSTINVTTTTLDYSDLQETTYFQAVVESGSCGEVPSASALVQIDNLSDGGTLAGSAEVCSGSNSTELVLNDYVGTIEGWESSASPTGPWISMGINSQSFTSVNLTETTYYRVIVKNGQCSSGFSSVASVTVIPETVGGSVSGSTVHCADDDASYTLTLTGHVGEVLYWERSLTGQDQWSRIEISNTTLEYSDLQETTYFRAVVQSGACEVVASAFARIHIDGVSEGGVMSGTTTVCSGTNRTELRLTEHIGTIIDWQFASSNSGPWFSIGHTAEVYEASNLTATTFYRAVIQNGVCGPVYSSVASITVDPQTDAGILSGNATVCQGDNGGYVMLSGIVGEVVRWEFSHTGEQPWTPVSSSETSMEYVNLDQTTWYRAIVQNGVCGQEISNLVEITVDTPSDAGEMTGTDEVCLSLNTGTLTLEQYNGAILKWQKSTDTFLWEDITNITNQHSFTNLTTSTYYRAHVQYGVCNVAISDHYLVTVNELPDVAFSVEEVCEGVQSAFNNETSLGLGDISSYVWHFDDGESSTISNPSHTYQSFGTYAVKLIAASSAGCVDSVTHDVLVNPNPVAKFSQIDVCHQNQMDFSSLSTVNLGSISTYNWSLGDSNTQLGGDFSHTYSEPGEYQVSLEVITDKGCRDNTAEYVEVYPLPVTAFETDDVCYGEISQFSNNSSIGSGTISYSWNFGDGMASSAINPVHEFAAAGTYNVNLMATSANGCHTDQTEVVEVFEQPLADFSFEDVCLNVAAVFEDASIGDFLDYAWDLGNGLTSSESDPSQAYEVPGLYQVKLHVETSGGCFSEKIQTLRVSPLPVVSFEMEDVCLEDEVQFTNHSTILSGSMTFNWSFGDGAFSSSVAPRYTYGADGTYLVHLQATSNYGCTMQESKEVSIYPLPQPDFIAESVCDGSMTYFIDRSIINDGEIEEYLWDFGDQSNSILPNPEKQYLNPGIYDVAMKLTSDKGCKADMTKQVVVYDFPVANFSADNECFGFEIRTNNKSEIASGSMTYLWDFGDGSTSTSFDPSHLYAEPGIYTITLTATSGNNCSDIYSRQVEVYATPEVTAGQDTSVSQGYSVQLRAGGGVSYSWYPLDGLDNSSVYNPIATPLQTTDYEVAVTDQYGCINHDTIRVNVIEDFKIEVNNVFTPDGNGQNDAWVINNVETFGDVNVRVYDRYGALVFQEKAYKNNWSGASGKDLLPDGTYFYVITFSESSRKYQGALTIIRNR